MARILNVPAIITAAVTARLTTARLTTARAELAAGRKQTPAPRYRHNEEVLCTEIDHHCVGRNAGWRE